MCDLCFIPRCDCESSLVDSQTVTPAAASGSAVLDNPAPTVTVALALDSTQYWTSGTVRFGFPDTAAGFTGALSYYSPFNEPGTLRPLSDFGRDSLRDGVAQWDAVTALTIVEAAPGTTAEINVGVSTAPSTAWAYYPGGQAANGDVWFNTSQWFLDALQGPSEPIIGSYAYATGIHEFGHALGLKHPHQVSGGGREVLDPDYDAVEFSIMSYRSYPGGPTGAYTVENWGYPQSPMMLDIAMIQRIYGADYDKLAGDTTYTVSTANGEMFVDGVSLGVPGANRVFRTVWDGNGTDHVDLSNYATDMHADLNPGRGIRFDTDGNFQAAKLVGGVHAGFNIYMSMLHAGDTRSLIENLTTGAGDDILIGNAADNALDGGGGVNTVIYAGNAAEYVINLVDGRVIGAATGTDTLINIARIQFDDRVLTLPGTAAPVVDAVDSVAAPVVPFEDPVDPVTPPSQFQVSGASYDLVEFAADAQGTGPAEIGPDGRSVTMTGDDWKAVEGTFEITADTVLRFTYASDVEGEIHGIGFANADATVDLMPERGGSGALFQIGGVTRSWGIENTAWDYAFGSGETTFEIAVGKYLEGTFDRMVFAMDDDAGRGSSATFADVELVTSADEAPTEPAAQFQVSGAGYDLIEFAADAQGTGPAEIGPDGRSVTMTGDDWKAVEGTFEITADTVLRFTYASDVEGEIHGIGFANADATVDLMPERGGSGALFQIGGVTRGWGIENTAWDYAFGSGETTFEIAVGKYLEGTFDRIVFAMDDDAGRGSSATFADVEMWQVPATTGETTATEDDILAAAMVDATQTLSQLSTGDMFDGL